MKPPWVLGLSCSHNASACLLHGDEIVAAVQEERLLRFKRQDADARFIASSVRYCLDTAGIRADQLDAVVYSVTRGVGPSSDDDIFLNRCLRLGSSRVPVISIPHHYAHAVSAFAASGFTESAVLVIDGSGTFFERLPLEEQAAAAGSDARPGYWEWLSYYEADGTRIRPIAKQFSQAHSPGLDAHEQIRSLGDMYGAIGALMFGDFFDSPGKVMGLAPYGRPTIPRGDLLHIDDDGRITFNTEAYRDARVTGLYRWPDEFSACADLAASVQAALEYALGDVVSRIRARSSSPHLSYAGGVALNSVANERIVRDGGFERVFIFPAAEDSGVAVGAAYHGLWTLTGRHVPRPLRHDAMGRCYTAAEIEQAVAGAPAVITTLRTDGPADVARLLCGGQIIGWFTGRSEMGPRSLGQRSILCDPRSPTAKDVLNGRVKHREPFRPFAPVVLQEHAHEWFDVPRGAADSPFMLRVWPFRPGMAAAVPAVAHVDGTARVQTIGRDTHPALYALVEAFAVETGVPMLLNTSFNVAGEPIVESPEDALLCLLRTGLDCCVFDDRIVRRQPGFRSLLDLRPHLRLKAITVEMPASDGQVSWWSDTSTLQPLPARFHLKPLDPAALQATVSRALEATGPLRGPVAHALVRTRWADVSVVLTDQLLRLVRMIDGATDGHALVREGPGWSRAWVEASLARLCGASVIGFKELPLTRSVDALSDASIEEGVYADQTSAVRSVR